MAEIGILTSQHVRIDLPTASLGDRILAQMVDWLVLAAYAALWVWIITELDGRHWVDDYVVWLVAAWLLPTLFYTPCCELFFHGQTLGKMALRTRVVMADGRQFTLGAALLRWVLWIVDGPSLSFLGLLVMVLNRHNQRLGDMAAGTVVVKLADRRRLLAALDDYDYLARDYTPRYPAAADLSLEQVDVVRRTLATPTADQPQRTALLAAKVARRLAVSPTEPTPAAFLERVVSDYQYYALEDDV